MSRIRKATNLDREGVFALYLIAFPESERQIVASLAVNLLSEVTHPETFALVAETDGSVAGHVAFSPVTIANIDKWSGYIMAPLGVKPEFQRLGIGSELIESGKERLSASGVNVLFVYGDPTYYGRFGFEAGSAFRYVPPYDLQYQFGWQAIVLNESVVPDSAPELSCVASLCDPDLW